MTCNVDKICELLRINIFINKNSSDIVMLQIKLMLHINQKPLNRVAYFLLEWLSCIFCKKNSPESGLF